MDGVIDGLVCLVLVRVIVEDVRHYRIRNLWVLVLLGLFAAGCLWSDDRDALVWHGLFGAVALVLMVAAYALGAVGAGDAKLMAAACLWLGPERAIPFAVGLTALALVYGAGASYGILPAKRVDGRLKIAFAPVIAGAWIAMIAIDTAVGGSAGVG